MRNRRRGCFALLAVTALGAGCVPGSSGAPEPRPLPAGVRLNVRERTYPVRGRTVAAIARSLESAGPRWQGRVVHGLAQWHLRWGWRSTMQEGDCRLADLRVLVQVEITLPEWKDHSSAMPSLALAWEGFEAALRDHEYRHRDIAVEAAAEVLNVLRSLRTRSCIEMGDVARGRAREIVRAYQSRTELFERNTQRGRNQGAVWPPGG